MRRNKPPHRVLLCSIDNSDRVKAIDLQYIKLMYLNSYTKTFNLREVQDQIEIEIVLVTSSMGIIYPVEKCRGSVPPRTSVHILGKSLNFPMIT